MNTIPPRHPRALPLPALLLALAAGCASPAPTPLPPPIPVEPWPGDDVRPALDHPLFDELTALGDLSLYATFVEGPVDQRPDHAHRGSFGIGNGRTFAFVGLADPVNTLHSLVGPVYEKEDSFFGDVAAALALDGEVVPFEQEWVARVRGAAVVVTRADAAGVSLYTVDFAPRPDDGDRVPPAIVRGLAVRNTRDVPVDASVVLRPYREPVEQDGLWVEAVSDRAMAYLPWGAPMAVLDGEPTLALGELAGGGSAEAALVLATGSSTDELHDTASRLVGIGWRDWLGDTLTAWQAFSARGVQLSTDDPRVEDLYDGMRIGVAVQQSEAGAICPMSEYTLVWLRDSIGPARFLLRAGLHDEALAAVDYLHLCHAVRGDYGNACDSDLSLDDLGEEPDWDALGPFGGRLAAEGPSYVPLIYRELQAFTGDLERTEQRWAYLRRALSAQTIDDQGRQPFSGDETFRVAMSAGLGYDLLLAYEEECWSANSSFLMAAAADWMAATAPAVGHPEDAADFEALAALARTALDETFAQPEGHYAPFVFRDGGAVEPRPYEDVNLKPLWCGALAPDDPRALANLRGLQAAAGRDDGTVQTPLDAQYIDAFGMDVEEGIATGMVPGYYLSNLTRIGDPDAAAAFDALHAYADTAGQYAEYIVYDDLSALQPIYDPAGGLGDYTARHRPWEGGINLDAMLAYLIGAQVGGDPDVLWLRPHLPNGWRRLQASGLRTARTAASMTASRVGDQRIVTVESEADEDFLLQLEVPVPGDTDSVAEAGCEPAGEGDLITLPGGERVVAFLPLGLAPGGSVTCTVTLR